MAYFNSDSNRDTKLGNFVSIKKSDYPNGYTGPCDGYLQLGNAASSSGTWLYVAIYNGGDSTAKLNCITYRTALSPYTALAPIFVKKGMRIVDTSDLDAYDVRFVPLETA